MSRRKVATSLRLRPAYMEKGGQAAGREACASLHASHQVRDRCIASKALRQTHTYLGVLRLPQSLSSVRPLRIKHSVKQTNTCTHLLWGRRVSPSLPPAMQLS